MLNLYYMSIREVLVLKNQPLTIYLQCVNFWTRDENIHKAVTLLSLVFIWTYDCICGQSL